MNIPPPRDYAEIQRHQWRITIPLTIVVFFVYTAFIAAILLLVSATFRFLGGSGPILSGGAVVRSLAAAAAVASGLALVQDLDARKNGPRFILRRLEARPVDPSDRYHKMFADTVDEIRIAAGLPAAGCYILPTPALNALALCDAGGQPVVAVTEGMLSEGTRDEVQAVVAHELAHVIRGDIFFITLLCSLADTFERISLSLVPEDVSPPGRRLGGVVGAAAALSAAAVRALSTLISRQREYLADAAGVELCRAPEALARALVKAKLKNAFVGDFSLTYSPLLIVSSDPLSENEGIRGRLFTTHPPLMARVERLAAMAHKTTRDIVRQVWDIQQNRKDHRRTLLSEEEFEAASRSASEDGPASSREKVWLIENDRQKWIGPLDLAELLRNPFFLPSRKVRNIQEGVEAPASEFPAVRAAARREAQKKKVIGSGRGLCPRCGVPLGEHYYEGIPVRICPRCLGKLVDGRSVDRILARKEFDFSPDLRRKAEQFEQQFLTNPLKAQKARERTTPPAFCPACGFRMAARPFNYQYFLPVEKCLSCYKIWFDADELEMLQILVERSLASAARRIDQSKTFSRS